ncbi:MAG: hypothetical protein Q7S18_00815 [bacterium]|nr:hypothetical protein [bacterium]
MRIEIELSQEKICLKLFQNKKLVDSLTFHEKENLSQTLLVNLDKLLKRNKIAKNQLERISLTGDIPDFYTSSRIAKTLEKTWSFALKTR